ncbi:MAG: hypothetical protein JWN71_3651 [Xanthobacteraceae bacterium]|jgi:hypothetical protein|nr:hypothetical protein [Xanthobacteraceae bacterium]
MANGLPVERLREFLRELKPGARALLIAELERGLVRGDDNPGTELVLQELRRSIRDTTQGSVRIGDPARLFFQPVEPFLVDDAANHTHKGRIARVSLEPIWAWIGRDMLPAEANTFAQAVSDALLSNDTAACDKLARTFQDRAVKRIEEELLRVKSDDKGLRQLTSQVGTPRAMEDVHALLSILKARDTLNAMSARLPGHIKNLADEQLHNVKTLLDTFSRNRDVFLYALLLVMSRLANSWQLIRLATKAAESDKAARINDTAYGVAVTIVLAEIDRMVGELRSDLRSGRGIAVLALLKSIHDAARGVRTELDLPVDQAWGRQLATTRSEISNLLKSEIESMPGRVRRLLRPRPAKEIVAGAVLDASDVDEVEKLVEFVGACRHYAAELAASEMTMRNYSEMQQYLERSIQQLIEGLRSAGEADRPFRRSQVDAAIRFCGKVFGPEYAATLTKAADIALNGASERKVVKA